MTDQMKVRNRSTFVALSFAVAGVLASQGARAGNNCAAPGPNQIVLRKPGTTLCDVLEIGSYPPSTMQSLSVGTSGYWMTVDIGTNVWPVAFGGSFSENSGFAVRLTSGQRDSFASWSALGSMTVSPNAGPRRLNNLSVAERAQLLSLIKGYVTESVISVHGSHADWHEGTEMFFAGHRGYLAGMEAYFRAHGGQAFVPIPIWDPKTPIPSDFTWVKPNADGTARPALQNLNPGVTIPSQFLTGCTPYDFDIDMEAMDLMPYHDEVHVVVGGAMGRVDMSPAAAIFWPWHSYVDRIYTIQINYAWTCDGG